jgi:F0F1-type ATP synthase assembly protein I
MSEQGDRRARSLALGMSIAGLGFSLGISVAASIWAGTWVDKKLGTSPLFLVFLLLAVLYGSFRRLLWVLKQNSGES